MTNGPGRRTDLGRSERIRRRPTLPHGDHAVPSALEGLTAVFGMGTGVSPPPSPPEGECVQTIWTGRIESKHVAAHLGCESYGQAARPFSTGQLHVLRRFHTRPINLVVFEGPLGTSRSRDALSRGGLPAYMLSAVIPSAHSYPAMRLAPQPDH